MAQVEGVTSPELARLLEKHRDEINRAYRQRAASGPMPTPQIFLASFGRLAEAAVGALSREAKLKEAAGPAVLELFRVWLELSAKAEAGLEDGLGSLMGAFPGPLAQDPAKFLRASASAISKIQELSRYRPAKWLEAMKSCGESVSGLDEFLKAGLVAAWVAGLAQYRKAAIREVAGLAPKTLAALFGLGNSMPDPAKLSASLEADPWADPATPSKGDAKEKAFFTTIGGWQGYGGQFAAQPKLAEDGDSLLACAGEDRFSIYADRWGAVLVREPGVGAPTLKAATHPEIELTGDGIAAGGRRIRAGEMKALGPVPFPAGMPGSVASAAMLGSTVYFTHPLSYRIFIIGLPALQRHHP